MLTARPFARIGLSVYSNPEIPEGINNSDKKPLKDFFILTGGILLLLGVSLLIIMHLVSWWAPAIPFRYEQQWASSLGFGEEDIELPVELKLNQLAQELLAKMPIEDENITITIHYIEDEMINAFATLGGHIFIFEGLMKELESENALAMVLSHEIAHIVHRDPIVALARQIGASTFLSLVMGNTSVDSAAQGISLINAFSFSRDQETDADEFALEALYKHYGHINGATELFEVLKRQESGFNPEFLSTHPITQKRIDRIQQLGLERNWPLEGPLTPLNLR